MKRKAIMIIHGFSGNLSEVEHLSNYLQFNSGFDVYAFTLPGHEKSVIKGIKYQDWINASVEFLDKLITKYKTIYLVGHSMGGVIASYLASIYKEVDKLVLLAPAFMYINFDRIKELVNTKNKKLTEFWTEDITQNIAHKLISVPFKTVIEFKELVKKYYDVPKNIECETLILQGSKDDIVPIESSLYVYNNIIGKNKYINIIDGIGHGILTSEKKEEINFYILCFLEGGLRWKKMKELKI